MRRFFLLIILLFTFTSCSKGNDSLPLKVVSAPITELSVPEYFEFGETYRLLITYQLPSSCYNYFDVDYQYNGYQRDISILIYEDPEAICPQVTVQQQKEILVKVTQYQDYTFNIWKGVDNLGHDIIASIVVPVRN